MRRSESGGFTVVEVTIFLAITALMLTIALMGTGRTINNARFTDSVRSFESFMQRQFDETLNGVNSRSVAACNNGQVTPGVSQPGTTNCLLLGRYMYFETGSAKVQIRHIVGRDVSSDPSITSDSQAIAAATPRVVQDIATDEYEIPWVATVHGMKRDSDSVNSIAILRSPRSPAVYVYSFNATQPVNAVGDISSYIAPASASRQTNICIRSQDGLTIFGAVTVAANARGQDAISSRIDITSAERALLCEGA